MFLYLQIGRDVAECLQLAMSRKGLDVRVAALVSTSLFLFLASLQLLLRHISLPISVRLLLDFYHLPLAHVTCFKAPLFLLLGVT